MPLHEHIYPLRLAPQPSRATGAICLGLHLVAGVLFASDANSATAIAVFSLVLSLSYLVCRRYFKRHYELVWMVDGHWSLRVGELSRSPMRLLPSTVVSRFVVFLHLRDKQGFVCLVVARDSLPADAFRRLRVRLKIDSSSMDR